MKEEKWKFEDPTWKDWVKGIGLIILYLSAIGVSAFVLIPKHWIWWLLLILGGMLLLTLNQFKNYACRCRSCGEEFRISFLTNLVSPHGIDKEGSWLWVKCPSCGKREKVSVIRIVKGKQSDR